MLGFVALISAATLPIVVGILLSRMQIGCLHHDRASYPFRA
jgi:hypothetical protein